MTKERMKEIKILIPEELLSLILPEKAVSHLSLARKEILLALRSLIDSKIEALEKKEEKRVETKKKIKVE